MSVTVTMPEVAETIVEGTIARWLKHPGDPVERYESIAEIVTDKVTLELPSPAAGFMGELLVAEGETVTVGTPIAILQAESDVDSTPRPAPEAQPSAENGAAPAPNSRQARHSPLVRRLAEEHGIDLSSLQGTGAGGRITKADVLQAAEKRGAGSEVAAAATGGALDPVRRAIALRMTQSARDIPHAWTMMEVDVSGLVALVKGLKEEFRSREGLNLTYLPFILQAVASALRSAPEVNSSWQDDRIVLKNEINLGIAVARDKGLIVPVLKNADRKTVAELTRDANSLIEKARDDKLGPADVQGGTFTVNNTGALGSVLSMPLINPPQAAIMTTEAIVKRPVVIGDDAIAVRSMMNLCLSFDHRALDGDQAIRLPGPGQGIAGRAGYEGLRGCLRR